MAPTPEERRKQIENLAERIEQIDTHDRDGGYILSTSERIRSSVFITMASILNDISEKMDSKAHTTCLMSISNDLNGISEKLDKIVEEKGEEQELDITYSEIAPCVCGAVSKPHLSVPRLGWHRLECSNCSRIVENTSLDDVVKTWNEFMEPEKEELAFQDQGEEEDTAPVEPGGLPAEGKDQC